MKTILKACLLFSLALISACATKPPHNANNICSVFKQYPSWYRAAKDVSHRWKVPEGVQMAIIYQESSFKAHAKPPRTRLLFVIPWSRPSDAYGYTQALSGTWSQYRHDKGHLFSSRTSFTDGVDFIGWYANQAYLRAHIARNDAYALYLAYHEGVGGYMRKTYLQKPWLMAVAKKVAYRASIYQSELERCYTVL